MFSILAVPVYVASDNFPFVYALANVICRLFDETFLIVVKWCFLVLLI